jgi:radical SAM enzyme (TIGR01210 family)
VYKGRVNNEFTVEDYENAARVAEAYNTLLKCYVLVKPPFLTEKEALEEAVATARRVTGTPALEALSFNPVSVHKNTLVEELFHAGDYSPPWLWTVVEVLRRVSEFADAQVHSDVVAGGQPRGAHNFGACDEDVLRAIDAHKLTGDTSVFDRVDCPCKELWLEQLDLEDLGLAGGGLASQFHQAAGEPGGRRHAMHDWFADPEAA